MLYPGLTLFEVSNLMSSLNVQAHGDLVSAVDFNEDFLMTGYEDANVGVWSMSSGHQIHNMLGHNNNNNNKPYDKVLGAAQLIKHVNGKSM